MKTLLNTMLPVLKSWQLGQSAINLFLTTTFLLLLSCGRSNGQSLEEKAYYDMIQETMAKDTVVDALTEKFIRARMATDRMTKEDSIKYYNMVRSRKSVLYRFRNNTMARKVLASDSREYWIIEARISEEAVQRALSNVPSKDDGFDKEKVGNNIELVDELPESEIWHKFSSPIAINKEQFLVYHTSGGGINHGFITEIIIFSVKQDGGSTIDENILLSLY